MKLPQRISSILIISLSMAAVIDVLITVSAKADPVHLTGKIAFSADTNVRMFRFAGQTTDFQSVVERTGNRLIRLELSIPVNSLTTGIDIRDKHMRERVFTAANGSTPDIVYSATESTCRPGSSSSEQICQINGQLSFRGETHPQPIQITLKNGNEADGSAKVDVTQWGVTQQQLSYSGIHVVDLVNLDFSVNVQ